MKRLRDYYKSQGSYRQNSLDLSSLIFSIASGDVISIGLVGGAILFFNSQFPSISSSSRLILAGLGQRGLFSIIFFVVTTHDLIHCWFGSFSLFLPFHSARFSVKRVVS